MFTRIFNSQERKVLVMMCAVLIIGSTTRMLVARFPQVDFIINSLEQDRFVRQVEVNTAGYDVLVGIPYIGDYTARQIMQHRPFKSIEDVAEVPGIRAHNFERFKKYLRIRVKRRFGFFGWGGTDAE